MSEKKTKKEKQTIARSLLWAGVFGSAGVLHFVAPKGFDGIVPESLPGTQRQWTHGSGVAELGLSGLLLAGLANPDLRPIAGQVAGAFLVGVWPGNIKMAWDWRNASLGKRAIAWGRVPLQIPMVYSVLKIR